MNEEKQYFDNLDLLKALAIFFVVIYHSSGDSNNFLLNGSFGGYSRYYLDSILSTCVPIFFFVNGYILLNSKKFDWKNSLKKLARTFSLTIFWATVVTVILALMRGTSLSARDLYQKVWLLEHDWTWHFWFMKELFAVYVFYPLLYCAYHYNAKSVYAFFIASFILIFGDTFISDALIVLRLLTGSFQNANLLNSNIGDFIGFSSIHPSSIVYFTLGGIIYGLRSKLDCRKYKILAAIVMLISTSIWFVIGVAESIRSGELFDIVWNGYGRIFICATVVAMYVLSLSYRHHGILGKIIKIIGQNTLGIYIFHLVVYELIYTFIPQVKSNENIIIRLVTACLILTLSLVITIAIRSIKPGRQLFKL